jgi:D-threo-aldose 1-dehydrogenase
MDPMAGVRLGRTGLTVTRLGLGCAPIGGLYEPVSDADAYAVVEHAWERGLRLFDTAPLYGSGLSERRLGLALQRRPRTSSSFRRRSGADCEPMAGRTPCSRVRCR